MTNEVSSIAPVTANIPSPSVAETQSSARSESGKQVPPPGQVQPEASRNQAQPSQEEILMAVEKFSQHAKNLGRELQFEIDSDSGKTIVKVVDPETEEIVRQIPSEEAVERARSSDVSAMTIISDRA